MSERSELQHHGAEELPHGDVLARIAELAEALTAHDDPAVAATAGELLDWVDAFHRDGLGRLVDMIRAWRGEIFLEAVAADELAGPLLAAYDLGDDRDVASRAAEAVAAALATVRPTVESHGGSIDVEAIVDGVVRLRLAGTCDGCPSSQATLTDGIEAALREAWPSFRRVEVVDPPLALDPARAVLECVPPPPGVPVPTAGPVLVEIRGHEGA